VVAVTSWALPKTLKKQKHPWKTTN
jgi:hypothetical protein